MISSVTNWFLFAAALMVFFSIAKSMKQRRFLNLIFYVGYFLPFIPIVMLPITGQVNFWPTSEKYIFKIDDPLIFNYSLVLFFSTLGVVLFEIVARTHVNIGRGVQYIGLIPYKHFFWPILIFTLILNLFLFFWYHHYAMYSVLTLIMILTLISFEKFNRYRAYAIHSAFILFSYAQVINNDREFLSLFVFLLIANMSSEKSNVSNLKKIFIGIIIMILLAITVSITRNGNDFNLPIFLRHLIYNSWTASTLPLIDFLLHDKIIELRYGQTFFDAFLSSFFKLVFSLFSVSTPYSVDNPARWFYETGLGGAHLSLILLANFGFWGITFVIFTISWLISVCEKFSYISAYFSLVTGFLYLYVIHLCWYSVVPLFNAFVHAFYIYLIFILVKFLVSGVTKRRR